MPVELSYLVAASALFFVYILGEVVAGNLQYSARELLGARDNLTEQNTAVGRAKRATSNMVEAMVMFVPLVLVAHATNNLNSTTALGAAIFFWARVVYAPCYWLGIPMVRTLAWFAGVIGLVMIFLQVLPFSGAAA